MRKAILAIAMMIACAPWARGQCTGYSANVVYTPLFPADVAQRGGVTVTIAETVTNAVDANGNGGVRSHNVTGTPGTRVRWDWTSNNATSVYYYYTIGNDPTQYGPYSVPLNGSYSWATTVEAGELPHTFVFVANGNGQQTTDRITLASVPGNSPSIVSQDMLPINGYAQVTINFGGGSMLNNCQQCQGGSTQHCLQATHTPYVTMTAVNHTTGESQSLARQQAGNVATATESVSGTGSIWISVLPGDDVGGTANAEIFCTMFGDLPVSGNDDWGIDWELAWTKFSTIQSSCLPASGNPPSIGCKVTWKYMCNTNSQPPDLQPTIVFAEFDTNGNPVTLETVPPFWWGWGFGIRGHVSMFTTPWIFPANVLQQIIKSDWLAIGAGAFPSNSTIRNCTNKDKGTKPEIFPPFDQPL